MSRFTISCPCLFGLESVLSGEIRRMGGEEIAVQDGRVTFAGEEEMLARANIALATAERVQILLGRFEARSFEELFEGVRALPLEEFIGRRDAFPVKGSALNSQLHSVPDCQSIIKKAAVRRLEAAYGQSWFEETGPVHQIQFSIRKDEVLILLDTSGAGLHKRGYRRQANLAPIKETLAAGIADLARVREDDVVCDPFCGSGTLLIEAAYHALRIAPGLRRRFALQDWGLVGEEVFRRERERALSLIRRQGTFRAYGSDIDPEAVELAAQNAAKAGVKARIKTIRRDIGDFVPPEGAIVLCNPPYGERMLDLKEARSLYRTMGQVLTRPGVKSYIISPDEEFESVFGKKADRRRKLYNGMLRCQLFMYYR